MDVLCSWHPWPVERAWPLRADEEATFVTTLADAAEESDPRETARPEGWTRSDLTAVVTALRQGVTGTQLLTHAPGRHPATLHAAYRAADQALHSTLTAFDRLLTTPTMSSLSADGPVAARLLPRPVADLVTVAYHTAGAGNTLAAGKIRAHIAEASAHAAALEEDVAAARFRDDACIIARELFHPQQSCAWSHAYFVPSRVGQLTPIRLADLLQLPRRRRTGPREAHVGFPGLAPLDLPPLDHDRHP